METRQQCLDMSSPQTHTFSFCRRSPGLARSQQWVVSPFIRQISSGAYGYIGPTSTTQWCHHMVVLLQTSRLSGSTVERCLLKYDYLLVLRALMHSISGECLGFCFSGVQLLLLWSLSPHWLLQHSMGAHWQRLGNSAAKAQSSGSRLFSPSVQKS